MAQFSTFSTYTFNHFVETNTKYQKTIQFLKNKIIKKADQWIFDIET